MDNDILKAAVLGYESQLNSINQKLAELRAQLAGKPVTRFTKARKPLAKRATGRKPMSAAGRKRIADAQKARWRAFHRKQKAAA